MKANGGPGKPSAGMLSALLPIALAELLVDKGIITKDELNKAIAKTALEMVIKQRVAKSDSGSSGKKKGRAKAQRRGE